MNGHDERNGEECPLILKRNISETELVHFPIVLRCENQTREQQRHLRTENHYFMAFNPPSRFVRRKIFNCQATLTPQFPGLHKNQHFCCFRIELGYLVKRSQMECVASSFLYLPFELIRHFAFRLPYNLFLYNFSARFVDEKREHQIHHMHHCYWWAQKNLQEEYFNERLKSCWIMREIGKCTVFSAEIWNNFPVIRLRWKRGGIPFKTKFLNHFIPN